VMNPLFDTTIYTVSTWIIPLLLAITLHEAAHGYVAHAYSLVAWACLLESLETC
jgi:hypothetical protein